MLRSGVAEFDDVRGRGSPLIRRLYRDHRLCLRIGSSGVDHLCIHAMRLPLRVVFLSRLVTYAACCGFLADFSPATRYAIRLSSLRPVVGLADFSRVKVRTLMEGGTEYRSVHRASIGWPELEEIAMPSPYRIRRLWRTASRGHHRL